MDRASLRCGNASAPRESCNRIPRPSRPSGWNPYRLRDAGASGARRAARVRREGPVGAGIPPPGSGRSFREMLEALRASTSPAPVTTGAPSMRWARARCGPAAGHHPGPCWGMGERMSSIRCRCLRGARRESSQGDLARFRAAREVGDGRFRAASLSSLLRCRRRGARPRRACSRGSRTDRFASPMKDLRT